MADGSRLDQSHGDFELMNRCDSWQCSGDRVQPTVQRGDPSVSAKMIESFPQIGILEADTRTQFTGAFYREDTVVLRRQDAEQIYSNIGALDFVCCYNFDNLQLKHNERYHNYFMTVNNRILSNLCDIQYIKVIWIERVS